MPLSRCAIVGMQVTGYDYKNFVPYHVLEATFTRERVLSLLTEITEIQFHHREELADAVVHSGLRLFAILVDIEKLSLLEQFLKFDNFASRDYDGQLPMDPHNLTKILGEDNSEVIDIFCRQQWTYLPLDIRKNRLCRIINPQIILPFEKVDDLALKSAGAFGKISVVKIYSRDPSFQVSPVRFPEVDMIMEANGRLVARVLWCGRQ